MKRITLALLFSAAALASPVHAQTLMRGAPPQSERMAATGRK